MEFLQATYHLDGGPDSMRDLAAAVLLEQTNETPRSVGLRYPFVRNHLTGHAGKPIPTPEGGFLVTLSLPTETASADPAQFLNVLFGNSSLHRNVRLVDFELPDSLKHLFHGPSFGIEGLRVRFGIMERPLTASALKPVGMTPPELASLCRTFAEGGIDIIKDDHFLGDHHFCPFEDRVLCCMEAVNEVVARTGRRSAYVPNLSGTPDQILRQLEWVQKRGVAAVMVAPMLVGLPFFYDLARRWCDVPIIAHPSFSGTSRIEPAALLGKLFRLFGADAVIYVNYGGRFSYPQDKCMAVADALRKRCPPFRCAFPVPAGGMTVDRAEELIETYGRDTILLIGGSLLEAGKDLLSRTKLFTRAVEQSVAALPTS